MVLLTCIPWLYFFFLTGCFGRLYGQTSFFLLGGTTGWCLHMWSAGCPSLQGCSEEYFLWNSQSARSRVLLMLCARKQGDHWLCWPAWLLECGYVPLAWLSWVCILGLQVKRSGYIWEIKLHDLFCDFPPPPFPSLRSIYLSHFYLFIYLHHIYLSRRSFNIYLCLFLSALSLLPFCTNHQSNYKNLSFLLSLNKFWLLNFLFHFIPAACCNFF